jgi:large subunit ribosomal protein L10
MGPAEAKIETGEPALTCRESLGLWPRRPKTLFVARTRFTPWWKGGNPLPREEKVREVEELAELLSRSGLVVLTDYRGLTVADMGNLRRKLRAQGVEYRVAKNTLLGFAADKAGKPALREALVGPSAVAFSGEDIAALAKTLGDYERGSKVFKVKAGLVGRQLVKPGEVAVLAALPARPVLLSQVVAGFQSPIAGLVGVLSGVLGGLVGTLEARRQQLEEQTGAAS